MQEPTSTEAASGYIHIAQLWSSQHADAEQATYFGAILPGLNP